MRRATMILAVVATVHAAGTLHGINNGCPRNFNLAAATFAFGQAPKSCRTTQDCGFGLLCCPAIASPTNLCLSPSSGNGPFPGSSLSGNRPSSISRPISSFNSHKPINSHNPLVNSHNPINSHNPLVNSHNPINSHNPLVNSHNPLVNSHNPLNSHRPLNSHNPLVNGRCPANFRLAAATFPIGQSPQRCSIARQCPLGQLCCPVIDSVSDLCLSPASGFPGSNIPGSKPIVFPGQVASNVHQGRCPPAINLAVVRFPQGLPIYCGTPSDCPKRQLCCPAVNPTSKICSDPAFH